MSRKVPQSIREKVKDAIWKQADDLGWVAMSDRDRAIWYENWAEDGELGGVLAHFMDPRRVRVYIKDSLLKPYMSACLADLETEVLRRLSLPSTSNVQETFQKPHGRLFSDGNVVSWGNARDWKAILLATFERAYGAPSARPYAAVLVEQGRRLPQDLTDVIEEARRLLGIRQLLWFNRQ